ncbi:FtsX-like permease family protein [Flammeovirga sp. MY04]|uniref:ABC transporter permease n=1 Tax=Flammeovirga sp. MY04 TaxID=1191459 RepID=UPI00080629CF|nr:ABC transporter permease [Flammeovirga sp. MY04]ANQ48831.1 FtsX-like permease family protein [Flammeovirga sp. MY04]
MITYIKLAWHSLQKNPFFSFIILFGISMTIMVVMFIGSILDTSFGSNDIYKNMDLVLSGANVRVNRVEGEGYSSGHWHYQSYKEYFSKMKSFEVSTVTLNHYFSNVYYNELGKKITRLDIDQNFTEIFPLQFLKGRSFSLDDIEQKRQIAIITDELAADLFGKEDPIGKKIKTNSQFYEIVGVVEKENKLRRQAFADIYTPFDIYRKPNPNWHQYLGSCIFFMKFKDKDHLLQGQKEFQQIVKSLPIDSSKNEMSVEADFLSEKGWMFDFLFDMGDENMYYVYLYSIVLICMAIPALSLINLNITRITERTAEMGIRKAFGASSFDLLRQLLIENVFTTLIGGVIGIILAYIATFLFNTYSWMGADERLEINYGLLVFGFGCTLFFSVLSGFYPALKVSNFGIINSLKSDKQ